MAEQEVIKHTKKVYKIWARKDFSFAHKLKEFVVEIVIIVFAVSLSIWFHDYSEHKHQQKEVKVFLTTLKKDLLSDVKEMQGDIRSYQIHKKNLTALAGIKQTGTTISTDSLDMYFSSIYSLIYFFPGKGSYEGFKSSGKLGNIENKELLSLINELYEEAYEILRFNTEEYNKTRKLLMTYVDEHVTKRAGVTNNWLEVLTSDKAHNLVERLIYVDEIISIYQNCITISNKIIGEVEKKY